MNVLGLEVLELIEGLGRCTAFVHCFHASIDAQMGRRGVCAFRTSGGGLPEGLTFIVGPRSE
jgi:hypothetical protein